MKRLLATFLLTVLILLPTMEASASAAAGQPAANQQTAGQTAPGTSGANQQTAGQTAPNTPATAGTGNAAATQTAPANTVQPQAQETPTAGGSKYSQQLTPTELELYQLMLDSFNSRTASFNYTLNPAVTVTDNGEAVSKMAYRAFEAVYRDHPEVFWVTKQGGMKISLSIQDTGGQKQAAGMGLLVEFYQPDQVTQKQAKLEAAVTQILVSAPADIYERIKYFHDTLTAQCSYDTAAKQKPSSYPEAYESYGALVNHKAVCEGYAKAFKLLCDRSNIPCVLVGGTANNEAHMWNYVQVGGQYYLVDATFDDPINGQPTQNYLLKGSETTAKDHKASSGFLQGLQSGFTDPALSAKDYDPATGNAGTVSADTAAPASEGTPAAASADTEKKYCKLTYQQSAGGVFTVSYLGVQGALDPKQSVLNGVGLSVQAYPSNGYTVSEIKIDMGAQPITETARGSLNFIVSDDCTVQVTFKKK